MPSSHIVFEDVSFKTKKPAKFFQYSFSISPCSCVCITGKSGSGKTLLADLITGLAMPDSGEISVLNSTPLESRSRVGYIPQWRDESSYQFPISVHEYLSAFPFNEAVYYTFAIAEIKNRVMKDLTKQQRLRVALAKVFLAQPQIVLLDNILHLIDIQTKRELLTYILNQPDLTVVYTNDESHELLQDTDIVLHCVRGGCDILNPAQWNAYQERNKNRICFTEHAQLEQNITI